jgi:hypothetical protein
LLKLGLHRGEGHLLLRHRGLHLGQGGARLLLIAVRRKPVPCPSPKARPSPNQSRTCPPWSECTDLGAHRARPSAGIPTSRCLFAGFPRGHRGHRIAPNTNRASSSTR